MAKDSKTAKRYAKAIFELALESKDIDTWLANIRLVCESAKNHEFSMILDSSKISSEHKNSMDDKVLS